MGLISNRDAVRRAIREEMQQDERVFLFGEDVAEPGGVFKVSQGLRDEFGPERVFDTPISESALAGIAVGAAMMGMRPILEIMFADFTTIAMDGIVNSAAKTRFLTAGELSAPLTIRMTYGAGARWGAQHTQSVESWLTNVPGLTIVMASTPFDLLGLLKSSIRSLDPVIFLEHKQTYSSKGEVPDEEYLLPIGQADVKRRGDDVTIVASGAMVERALNASQTLSTRGVSAEVVDIRTVMPLDVDTIVDSVVKTAHLVVVHEAPVFGGIGGEIAASVAQKAFGYLDAPVQRLGGAWAPVPFGQVLIDEYLPGEADLVRAALQTLGEPVS